MRFANLNNKSVSRLVIFEGCISDINEEVSIPTFLYKLLRISTSNSSADLNAYIKFTISVDHAQY
jgi:hypothetical protein